ncbi:MAG: hypothetical protein V4574_09665 [Pseudomonadota bacterium]
MAGVTDYGPVNPTRVGSFGEFLSLFGPASRFSMPEARTAFTNGVMEVVVARTVSGVAQKATLLLKDDEGDDVATLVARAEGAWGNGLSAKITQIKTLGGGGLKYVNLDIALDGEVVETLSNLVMDDSSPSYFFDQINFQSRLIVAYDAKFGKQLPANQAKTNFEPRVAARPAVATLRSGNNPVITVTASDAGPAGNLTAIRVLAGTLPGTVKIEVVTEGGDTRSYDNLADLSKIEALTAEADNVNPKLDFKIFGGATALPDAKSWALTGGRAKGPALSLSGGTDPLLELQQAPGVTGTIAVEIANGTSSVDGITPVVALQVYQDDALLESFADLTMDPDDANYLPAVLKDSSLIRAHDLFLRVHSTALPKENTRPQKFTGGVSPSVGDYQDALDRLEGAEEVDLVIASVANQLDDAGVRKVHQAVAAHCAKMADPARNRIGLGSVTAAATSNRVTRVNAILDHADDVRSNDFILTTPAGSEAAVAGLLSLQDYFQSPTFKNVPALGVDPGSYSDSELNQLVGGNVLVVNQKRRLGTIVVKGILTSGRQINVQRTANKAVRDVKAIADVYIGLLNNEGNRNALRQQIIAMFMTMTRAGALVPSTDGKDPPFKVEVYSTQADFATGIVRIDIAIRPVRAIDYIYATILVQN